MSTTGQFQFLMVDDERKLINLLCNYFSVGELELARTSILQIYDKNPHLTLKILKEIIEDNLPSEWIFLREQTKSHLQWFCILEFIKIRKSLQHLDNLPIIEEWRIRHVEFCLLMNSIVVQQNNSNSFTYSTITNAAIEKSVKDVIEYHFSIYSRLAKKNESKARKKDDSLYSQYTDENESGDKIFDGEPRNQQSSIDIFPNNTLEKLKDSFLISPLIAYSICRHLCSPFLNCSINTVSNSSTSYDYFLSQLHDGENDKGIMYQASLLHWKNDSFSKEEKQIIFDNSNNLYCLYIAIIEEQLEKQQFSNLFSYLQYVNIISTNNEEFVHQNTIEKLKSVLFKLINTCNIEERQMVTTIQRPTSIRLQIYQSLSGCESPFPLQFYCKLEDSLQITQSNVSSSTNFQSTIPESSDDNSLPLPFELIWADKMQKQPIFRSTLLNQNDRKPIGSKYSTEQIDPRFWMHYFHYLRVSGNHIFEFVLSKSIEFLKLQRFDEVEILLKPFPKFKHLIILLVWEFFSSDLNSLQFLIDKFYDPQSDKGIDINLTEQCCYLSYEMKLAVWCARKLYHEGIIKVVDQSPSSITGSGKRYAKNISLSRKKSQSDPSVQITSQLIDDLEKHSLLYILRPCKNLEIDDMRHLLEPNIYDSIKTKSKKEHDYLMVSGYCILRGFITWFENEKKKKIFSDSSDSLYSDEEDEKPKLTKQNSYDKYSDYDQMGNQEKSGFDSSDSEEEEEESPEITSELQLMMNKAKHLLDTITSIPYKVGILEQILNFLFLNSLKSVKENEVLNSIRDDGNNDSSNLNADFYANHSIASAILRLLETIEPIYLQLSATVTIDKEEKEESDYEDYEYDTHQELEKRNEQELVKRVVKLRNLLQEGKCRIDVIFHNSTTELIKNYSFMKRIIASPDTLLMMCIRNGDYVRCNNVIDFFQLHSETSQAAYLAERLNIINIKLASGQGSHLMRGNSTPIMQNASTVTGSDEIYQLIDQLSPIEALILCYDLICASPVISTFCVSLLEKANELRNKITKDLPILPAIQHITKKINLLLKYYPHSIISNTWHSLDSLSFPFNHIYRSSQIVPQKSFDELNLKLKGRNNINIIRETVHTILSSLSPSIGRLRNNNQVVADPIPLLKSIVFSQLPLQDELVDVDHTKKWKGISNYWKDTDYFSRFILHILRVGHVLDEKDKKGKVKFEDYLNHLGESPDNMLGRMIFQMNDYRKAELLADIFRQDITQGVIHSITRGGISNQQVKDNIKSSKWISSKNNTFFKLNEGVLHYIESRSELLSMFVCMFKHPIDTFDAKFYNYALNVSSKLCRPLTSKSLYQWALYRLGMYSTFSNHILLVPQPSFQPDIINDKGYDNPSFLSFHETLVEEYQKIFQMITEEKVDRNEFFIKVVDYLMSNGKPEKAAAIADQYLDDGASDFILPMIIEKSDNKANIWCYILRLKDKELAAKHSTLELLESWDIDVCLELLSCLKSYPINDKKRIESLYEKLEIYREILKSDPALKNWQSVASICLTSPENIVRSLTKVGKFDIARKVNLLFDVNIQDEIEEENLYQLIKNAPDNDNNLAIEALIMLGDQAIKIAENLLFNLLSKSISKPTNLENLLSIKLFLTQYLISRWDSGSENQNGKKKRKYPLEVLKNIELGIKSLQALSIDLRDKYKSLICLPKYILEDLIMTEQLSEVEQLVKSVPQLQNDDTLLFYARKSMVIPSEDFEEESISEPVIVVAQSPQSKFQAKKASSTPSTPMKPFANNTPVNSPLRPNTPIGPVTPKDSYSTPGTPVNTPGRSILSPRTPATPGTPYNTPGNRASTILNKEHARALRRQKKKLFVLDDFTVSQRSIPLILTGEDPEKDELQRQNFQFLNSPSIKLLKTLVNLSSNSMKAAEECLQITNQLSCDLNTTGSFSQLRVINIAKQVVVIAKQLILKSLSFSSPSVSGSSSPCHSTSSIPSVEKNSIEITKWSEADSLEMCDNFVTHLELLQTLTFAKCNITISLVDFSNKLKVMQLRDQLIREDRIKLALDISTKCKIDCNPVWAAWGLSLLRIGKYDDAKEKFKNCMIENSENARQIVNPNTPSGDDSSVKQKEFTLEFNQDDLLLQIISILERSTQVDSISLREIEHKFNSKKLTIRTTDPFNHNTDRKKNPVIPPSKRPAKQTTLEHDRSRYMQCLYYLTKYGTPNVLIDFYMRNHLIEDAIRSVLYYKLPKTIFIDKIVRPTLARMGTQYLKNLLKNVDPRLQTSKEYLLDLCKYFSDHKAVDLLYDFQIFMGDYARSGDTCVAQYIKTSDVQSQLKFLDSAKVCFILFLDIYLF